MILIWNLGRGARYLGVGRTVSYRRDVVTVSLRGISTLTGEVLLNVQTKKTILSVGAGFDVFKFIDMDTELVEYEDGVAENESVTVVTRAAIEAAVLALIKQGDERGYWKIQEGERTEMIKLLVVGALLATGMLYADTTDNEIFIEQRW